VTRAAALLPAVLLALLAACGVKDDPLPVAPEPDATARDLARNPATAAGDTGGTAADMPATP
jgi:hypothetical protein